MEKIKNKIIFGAVIIFVISLCMPVFAMFKLPTPIGYVNDFAGVIRECDKQKLNSVLLELKQKTQAEVAVVTLSTLENYPVEDVALEIGRQWGIGKKGKDNGIVMLVAPNDRKVRIEVGYGLEGAIPDSKAGRIRDAYMLPYFKAGEYSKGIVLGTSAIVDEIAKEYGVTISGNYAYKNSPTGQTNEIDPIFGLIFFILFIFMAIKYPRFTIALMLLSDNRSSYGGSSGGGSFGGFSGGGFGGGGASGGW